MNSNKQISIIPEIFVSIVAAIAGILIYFSRFGFENNGLLIIESLFVSLFLIFSPHIVKLLLFRKGVRIWYFSKPLILLFSITLLATLGQFNIYDIKISIPIAVIGCIYLIISVMNDSIIKNTQSKVLLYIVFTLLGLFFTTVYYLSYLHPLMKEKIMTGAWAHRDPLYFASMAGMFKTYGTSSTGLDGLVPVYYHDLTYFMYGTFSNLLDISTITFFYIVAPIIITPLFLLSFIYSVNEVSHYYSIKLDISEIDYSKLMFWLLFAVLFMLPLPYQLIASFGGETYQYLLSSSYNFALLLTFILIGIIFSFINHNKENNDQYIYRILLVITSVTLYYLISISKVSFLFVLGVIYGYIFIRLKYYNNIYHIICMIGFLIVVALIYVNLLNTETFLKNPSHVKSDDISIITYLFNALPSLFFIILKIYSIKIKKMKDFVIKLKSNDLIDIEIMILLLVILFPLTYIYFKGIQIYFAYILIMSHFNLFRKTIFETT